MKISAVKLYENGFMTQPFAFGGEDYDLDEIFQNADEKMYADKKAYYKKHPDKVYR